MKVVNKERRFKLSGGKKLFLGSLPFLVLYFLFSYLPLEGWKYAFFNYKPGRALADCEFVGLKNFSYMFQNPVGRREAFRVLKNTITYSFIGMLTSVLPMAFAIFLNEFRGRKYKKFVQTVTTIPNFISWILAYSLAFAMFATDTGAVNKLLVELGVIKSGINFLGSGEHVYLSMTLFHMWKGLGWSAIIYLAAINSIDQELYEAAAVDGAGRFQKMWHITVPGLSLTFITLFLMNIGNFLSTGVDQYLVFFNAFNKEHIETLDLYVYNLGINSNNISYSTTIGMMKSIIGLFLLFVSNKLAEKIRGEKIF